MGVCCRRRTKCQSGFGKLMGTSMARRSVKKSKRSGLSMHVLVVSLLVARLIKGQLVGLSRERKPGKRDRVTEASRRSETVNPNPNP